MKTIKKRSLYKSLQRQHIPPQNYPMYFFSPFSAVFIFQTFRRFRFCLSLSLSLSFPTSLFVLLCLARTLSFFFFFVSLSFVFFFSLSLSVFFTQSKFYPSLVFLIFSLPFPSVPFSGQLSSIFRIFFLSFFSASFSLRTRNFILVPFF